MADGVGCTQLPDLQLTTYNLQLTTYDLQLTTYNLRLTTYDLQLNKHIPDDLPELIRQPEISALEMVGQPLVIDAQAM